MCCGTPCLRAIELRFQNLSITIADKLISKIIKNTTENKSLFPEKTIKSLIINENTIFKGKYLLYKDGSFELSEGILTTKIPSLSEHSLYYKFQENVKIFEGTFKNNQIHKGIQIINRDRHKLIIFKGEFKNEKYHMGSLNYGNPNVTYGVHGVPRFFEGLFDNDGDPLKGKMIMSNGLIFEGIYVYYNFYNSLYELIQKEHIEIGTITDKYGVYEGYFRNYKRYKFCEKYVL